MTTDALPEAGPALDAAVHAQIFGHNVRHIDLGKGAWIQDNTDRSWRPIPPYSTDWNAAGLVVERVKVLSAQIQVGLWWDTASDAWTADLFVLNEHDQIVDQYRSEGPSMPLAVCRAALAAVRAAGRRGGERR